MARRDYVRYRPDGGGVVVHWDSRACVFSHVCVRVLPDVFDVDAHPWVQPDKAGEDEVVQAVQLCRSAALALSRFEPGEEPPLRATDPPVPVGVPASERDEEPPRASAPAGEAERSDLSSPASPEIPRQRGVPAPRG